MSLNRTAIEYCDFTWNPIFGCVCGCSYCYARRLAKRLPCPECRAFKPHVHPERFGDPAKRKKPARIFVCDMGDIFGDGVREEWIERVYEAIVAAPQHTFQLLTKTPGGPAFQIRWPSNVWLGVTADSWGGLNRIGILQNTSRAAVNFISFEPLLAPLQPKLTGIDWIIIGAQTRPEIQPEREWVKWLITEARRVGAAVFLKDNLKWAVKVQEFPK